MSDRVLNATKLTGELLSASIPITGCNSNGVVSFAAEATQAHRDQAAAILAAHDPTPTREQAIRLDGFDVLVAALAVRLSSSWATVPLVARTRVQDVIDAAKSKIAARFS